MRVLCLTLKAPITTIAENISFIFFPFFIDSSCESSARQRIHMTLAEDSHDTSISSPFLLQKIKVKKKSIICYNFAWRFKLTHQSFSGLTTVAVPCRHTLVWPLHSLHTFNILTYLILAANEKAVSNWPP